METKISSQMLKGILSGSILILLSRESLYGYTLSLGLEEAGFAEIPKGTIYPLLLNLEKKGFIKGKMVPSPEGPSRKYYVVTPEGEKEKNSFINQWHNLKISVDSLLEGQEK